MANKLNHMQVEAAIQHAIRIGWKPEVKLGETMGDINISFIEISPDLIYYASKYIPDIGQQLDAALCKAAEELGLSDAIVGCEWSDNGVVIVSGYIYDRVMEFNRTHKKFFKSYFTNYAINGKWAPFKGYTDEYCKACYEKVLELAEKERIDAESKAEPLKYVEKLFKGKFTIKSGELVFINDNDIGYYMKNVQSLIEKYTKDFIDKDVEIMIQIREV